MSNFHIPLNGSNHISKERLEAFENALNEKHVINYDIGSNNRPKHMNNETKSEIPRPNKADKMRARDGMNKKNELSVSPDLVNSIEISLNQSLAHQNRTMDIHQKYLDQQGDYAQIIKEILNQQGKVLDKGNPDSKMEIIDSFQRSLDNFHQMREKGMEVHQQFLSQQADFSESFVRVLEKQHGLAVNGKTPAIKDKPIDQVTEQSTNTQVVIDRVELLKPEVEEVQSLPSTESSQQSPTTLEQNISPQVLADALLRIVGEKTGYPPEMLELEMDLEADLGIDSIKRVEILGALEEEFPSLPPADTEILSQTRTLEEIVDYLKSEAGQSAVPAPPETVVSTPPAAAETPAESQASHPTLEQEGSSTVLEGYSVEDLTKTLLEIVAEKTGYPAEMLDLEMDLEADLGIDSIKRVEILGAMEDRVPGMPQVETETLAELRTLEEIVSMMSSVRSTSISQVGKESESKKKVNGSPLDTTPVTLTALPKADFLEFEISPEHPVILTDEGSDFTLQLADALISEGWKVVLWSFAGMDNSRESKVNSKIVQVKVEDPSPDTLNEKLKALRNQFKSFSGFIHLHPLSEVTEIQSGLERNLIKMVFFLAGALKEDLTRINEGGRSIFMTVTRINGKLGFGSVKNFQEGGGLTGVVKTLSWEWPEVFTRAIDLDPEMNGKDQVECVIREIHDPNRGLVEVGLAQENRYTIEREGSEIS